MVISIYITALITFLSAMLAMSFYTLFERKALGYFQNRKGPNKVSLSGVPQPFADAIKLFSKEQLEPKKANNTPFMISPITMMNKYGVLTFLVVSSLTVYGTLIAGWASNSKYALIGALRSVALTISYEVAMTLILLTPLCIFVSFNMNNFNQYKLSIPLFLFFHIFYMWLVSILAETNRTPFDFAEGESELVSGFNTEFSGSLFAFIFMAEYTSIIIMSLFTSVFFMPAIFDLFCTLHATSIQTMIIAFGFIWVRASFPRMRYDKLMNLTWKTFLPMSLVVLMLTIPTSSLL
uniref:NADH-ubiquinone oxidoreductase chain 1 n=1 Tax=Decemunciger sp. AB-2017 TaxID=1980157 RepID=A0A1X9ZNR5_9ANNE